MKHYKSKKPLVLTMKGKWFDMIYSGEKREEYRIFKTYWMVRIRNWVTSNRESSKTATRHTVPDHGSELVFIDTNHERDPLPILFVNGYSKGARRFVGWCDKFTIRFGAEHPEWGEGEYDGKVHFVLHICKVEDVKS